MSPPYGNGPPSPARFSSGPMPYQTSWIETGSNETGARVCGHSHNYLVGVAGGELCFGHRRLCAGLLDPAPPLGWFDHVAIDELLSMPILWRKCQVSAVCAASHVY